jgi:metal-responsive CopG/Arc/MetJ family transcriptional regulator
MKRLPPRAPAKGKFRAVMIYFPQELIPLLDAAVVKTKSNRSKFIRQAVQEKLVVESS